MSYRYCYDCQSRCDSDDICHNCLDNAERELKTHAEGTKEFHFDGERFLNARQGPETEAHSPLPTGEGPGVGSFATRKLAAMRTNSNAMMWIVLATAVLYVATWFTSGWAHSMFIILREALLFGLYVCIGWHFWTVVEVAQHYLKSITEKL